MSPLPIALIFGSGSRVGAATTQAFLAANYRVARISRSQDPSKDTDTLLNIPGDLSRPDTVERVFELVRERWGEPSVVVYNGQCPEPNIRARSSIEGRYPLTSSSPNSLYQHPNTHRKPDLELLPPHLHLHLRPNNQHHLPLRRHPRIPRILPGPKTFLFTGNALNQGPLPGLVTLGVGKTGTAWMVELADQISRGVAGRGEGADADVRFFYVDERREDGTPMFVGLDGEGHAEAFVGLAERREGWNGLPWLVTFVSGGGEGERKVTGYEEFRRGLILPEGM